MRLICLTEHRLIDFFLYLEISLNHIARAVGVASKNKGKAILPVFWRIPV